jgi:hypothetical protein
VVNAETAEIPLPAIGSGDSVTVEVQAVLDAGLAVRWDARVEAGGVVDPNTDNNRAVVNATPASDADNDGVVDAIEDAFGDANGDHVPDSQQPNVATLRNAANGANLVLAVPASAMLTGVAAVVNPAPTESPRDARFPTGFFQFVVQGIAPGAAVPLTILLDGAEPDAYFKFGPTLDQPTLQFYEFSYDGTTGAEYLDDNGDNRLDRIVLHLVDGGRGDADLAANGRIADPGAPAIDPTPYQNNVNSLDVDNDRTVAPLDVLLIINDLNANGARELLGRPSRNRPWFVDTDGDNHVAPLDVLLVINHLHAAAAAEGESPGDDAVRQVYFLDEGRATSRIAAGAVGNAVHRRNDERSANSTMFRGGRVPQFTARDATPRRPDHDTYDKALEELMAEWPDPIIGLARDGVRPLVP